MSRRSRKFDVGFTTVTCDKCNREGHSKPGKPHRRCPGKNGAGLRPKHDLAPAANRGVWTSAAS